MAREILHNLSMRVLTRRNFITTVGIPLLGAIKGRARAKDVAAIVTLYTHNSHADVIVSRIVQGFNLDGNPPFPNLKLVSLYMDQVAPKDMG